MMKIQRTLDSQFDQPVVTLFGNRDPFSRGFDKELQTHVPGCKGQNHQTLKGVGHFSTQEAPEELANALLTFISQGASGRENV